MFATYAAPRAFSRFGAGNPNVNIYENEKELFLEVELPGFKREEVGLEVANRILTIRTPAVKAEREGYSLKYAERGDDEVVRSFRLGPNVEAEKVQARFVNGLLLVTVPKHPESQARKVEIG